MTRHAAVLILALAPVCALPAQESKALFDATQIQLDPWSRMDALLDVDHDGDIDGVGVWVQQTGTYVAEIEVHLNDGSGDFTSGSWVLAAESVGWHGWNEFVVTTGDFTGDGHDDIVAVGIDTLIAWQSNNGAQPTEIDRQTTLSITPREIIPIRANGDAFVDIAVRTNTSVELFLSNGATFSHAGSWPGTYPKMAAVEMDGDSIEELALPATGTLECVHWDGASFVTAGTFPISTEQTMPTCGDIDGDGDVDIVVFGTDGYTVLRRTGPNTFALEPIDQGGPATGLADVDGDGDLDGVCCGGGGPSVLPSNDIAPDFEISLNDGSGNFADAWKIRNIGARHIAGAVDADGDGDVDLIAGRGVYFNRDNFVREPMPPLRAKQGRWMRVHDLDEDGDPDFDIEWNDFGRNEGDGNERVDVSTLAAPPAGHSFGGPGYPGDFDGDGDVDFVVAVFAAGSFEAMGLLRNQGGGSFEYAGHAGPPGQAFHPANWGFDPLWGGQGFAVMRDFDDDGDLDIAANFVWNFNSDARSRIWHNDGTGVFTAGQLIVDYMVADAADFDGDGHTDLFATLEFGFWRIFKNDGNSNWAYSPTMPFQDGAEWTVRWDLNDIDDDGDVDLISDNSDRPILWRNQGNGTFVEESPIGAGDFIEWGGGQTRNFAVDVNHDGITDIVAYPAEHGRANSALIILQDSNGNFAIHAEQAIQPYAFADLDGDGDVDSIGNRVGRSMLRNLESGGTRVQFGERVAGQDGVAPTMGETGPYHVGADSISNVRGALGGAPAVYIYGSTEAELTDIPFPGLTMYAWPPIAAVPVTLGGSPNATGAGWLDVQYVVPAAFAGLTLYKQVFALDFAAPAALSQTNGIAITYGN